MAFEKIAKIEAAKVRKAKRKVRARALWEKKIPLPKLKKKLDELFSVYIRLRDKRRFGGICPFCLVNPIDCCFHFVHRAASNWLRWNPKNAVGACNRVCNFRMEMESSPFWLWYDTHEDLGFGLTMHKELERIKNIKVDGKIPIMSRIDLENVENSLKDLIENFATEAA